MRAATTVLASALALALPGCDSGERGAPDLRPAADPGGAVEGLFASPAAVRARQQARLAGEIERTLEGIAGVASARVHLALPVDDPLRGDATRARATASVVVLRQAPLPVGDDEIRRLVAHAVEGLQAADVVVVVASAPPPAAVEDAGRRSTLSVLLAASLLGLLVLSALCVVAVARLRALRRSIGDKEAGGR